MSVSRPRSPRAWSDGSRIRSTRLGEFRLTGPQKALLDRIEDRLCPDEREVWETLLDYLPNEMKEA